MVALPAIPAPSRALLWLATIPLLLIGEPVPGDRFFWPSLVYVPAILLLLADLRPPARYQAPAWRRNRRHSMSAKIALKDPRRDFEEIGADRSPAAKQPPVCLYLEVTNRCNLLCEDLPAHL